MSSSATISPPARTWRDIPQSIAPRAMSSTGRKRMILATTKSISALLIALVCLWAGYELFATWQENPAKIKAPVKSAPVKTVSLRTDGVLDHAWVTRTLALPKNADLMELDLYALRERLVESGQVRAAVLSRKFPGTLAVSLEERSPVARVNARFGEGEPETFLVARDGVVFQGACFKDEVVQTLPYLGGVALKRVNGKLLPIDGMAVVADLLGTARVNAPNLYRNWNVVSLERLGSDGHIVVQSPEVNEVIFGMRDDFYKQIARLDYILDESRKNPAPTPLKSINLAIGGEQVPVSFEMPAVEAPASVPAPTARSGATPARSRVRLATSPAPARSVPPPAVRAAPKRPTTASFTRPHRPASRRDF